MSNENQPTSRRGWRHFHCTECGNKWKWPSRDALSHSGENCPLCTEWCTPYLGEIDLRVPCDSRGNLTVPCDWDGRSLDDEERKRAERCVEVAGQLIGGNVNEGELLIKMPSKDFILGRRMGQTVFVRFSEPPIENP